MSLRLDWVGHDAVKFACEHWHYSKCVPVGKLNAIGVWENKTYTGCITFSYGANNNMAKQYGLTQQQCVELTRIALNSHETPVSKLVSICFKLLTKKNPDLKLVISYADPEQDHIGAIYQAGNWYYVGTSLSALKVFYKGKWAHKKTVDDAGVDQTNLKKRLSKPKYKYLYPLTDDMRSKIEPLRKPYPKRASVVHTVEHPANQQGEGGSIPTLTHTATGKEPVRING